MAILDNNIVNVALPHMMSTFATNVEKIQWVVTAYAITFAILTLASNWLRHLMGLKLLYILALTIFTFGSVLCGLAWDKDSMVVFRIIQGMGGGLMLPTGMTMITEVFPPHERGAAFGLYGIVIIFAPTIGPTLGGYLVDYVGWRYIFYINLPIGIANVFLATYILRSSKKSESIKGFDYLGFTSLSVCLVALLIALSQGQREGWKSDYILTLFAFSIAGLMIFIITGFKTRNPIIDLSMFANLNFSLLCIMNFLRAVGLFGRLFLLPIFLQRLVGYTAMRTGILLMPAAMISGVISPIIGRLSDKFGPKYFIISGFAIASISQFIYRDLSPQYSYWGILWPQMLFGFAMGQLNAPITSTAMNVVRKEQVGMVSILIGVFLQVGGAFGIAFLETMMQRRQAFHYATYAEKINPASDALERSQYLLKNLWIKMGSSSYSALQKAKGTIAGIVNKDAIISSYQDAFIILTVICMIALIPAFIMSQPKRRA